MKKFRQKRVGIYTWGLTVHREACVSVSGSVACTIAIGIWTPLWQGYQCDFEGDEYYKKYLSFKTKKLFLLCLKIKTEFVFEDKLEQQNLYVSKMNPYFCDEWIDWYSTDDTKCRKLEQGEVFSSHVRKVQGLLWVNLFNGMLYNLSL